MFSKYQIVENLGKGSYGEVFKAMRTFALKKIKITTSKERKSVTREILTQRECSNHPNIVKIMAAFVEGDYVCVCLEYCDRGNLTDYVMTGKPGSSCIYMFMKQMACGLNHLHKHKIAHRDIKPDNILIDSSPSGTLVCKLADFGLARFTGEDFLQYMETQCGTLAYVAPEVFTGSYNLACDIFSLGVVFYAINAVPIKKINGRNLLYPLVGDCPFCHSDFSKISELIKEEIGQSDVCDIILGMLDFDRDSRLTADVVYNYLNG